MESCRPVPWWVWLGLCAGEALSFFLAALWWPLSVGCTVVWFTGLVVAASRQRRYRVQVRVLGPIRAVVVVDEQRALPVARRAVRG